MNTKLELDDELAFKLSEVARDTCRSMRGQALWYIRTGAEEDYRKLVEARERLDKQAPVAA